MDVSRTSKDNLLVIIFGALCFLMPNKKRFLPISLYVALAYALIMTGLNHWSPISVNVMMQSFYVASGLVFFASFYEKHTENGLEYILNGMGIGCIIQSLFVISTYGGFHLYAEIIQLFKSDIEINGYGANGIGSLGNANMLAAYVSLTAISLFRSKWAMFLPLPFIALAISGGIMGIVTLLAGALYYLDQKYEMGHKAHLYIASSALMVLAYFTGIAGMDTRRFHIWSEIFKRVDLTHFLFGRGPGWFADHPVLAYEKTLAIQEHNSFITAFNMFGVMGIAYCLPAFIGMLKRPDAHPLFASILFASFINAYGHFNLHQSTTAIIIIVAAAVCLAERKDHVLNV